MAGVIILSEIETASNPDILQGTRLQTVPSGGILTFEFEASENDDANGFTVSIQLPSGDTPMEGINVPAGRESAQPGVINEQDKLMASFPVAQGGHTVFSVVVSGTSVFAWRVTYTPAR